MYATVTLGVLSLGLVSSLEKSRVVRFRSKLPIDLGVRIRFEASPLPRNSEKARAPLNLLRNLIVAAIVDSGAQAREEAQEAKRTATQLSGDARLRTGKNPQVRQLSHCPGEDRGTRSRSRRNDRRIDCWRFAKSWMTMRLVLAFATSAPSVQAGGTNTGTISAHKVFATERSLLQWSQLPLL